MATYYYIERRFYCAIDEAVACASLKKLEHAVYLAQKLQTIDRAAANCEINRARKLIVDAPSFSALVMAGVLPTEWAV